MPLTDTAVRQAKAEAKDYTLADIDGLSLCFTQGHQKLALPLFAEWSAEASVAWDVSRVEPA